MGAAVSVNTVVNNVSQKIEQKFINKGDSKSEANCTQKISNIKVNRLQNCNITFSNECYATAQTTLISTADLSVELWQNLSAEQKAAAAVPLAATLGVQTETNNVDIVLKQNVENYCNSRGYVNNTIALDTVYINECIGEPGNPVDIKFQNLGNASSNCIMNLITEAAAKSTTTESGKQSGFNWTDILWPVVCIVIVFAILRIVFMFKTSTKDKISIERSKHDDWASRILTLRRS